MPRLSFIFTTEGQSFDRPAFLSQTKCSSLAKSGGRFCSEKTRYTNELLVQTSVRPSGQAGYAIKNLLAMYPQHYLPEVRRSASAFILNF